MVTFLDWMILVREFDDVEEREFKLYDVLKHISARDYTRFSSLFFGHKTIFSFVVSPSTLFFEVNVFLSLCLVHVMINKQI